MATSKETLVLVDDFSKIKAMYFPASRSIFAVDFFKDIEFSSKKLNSLKYELLQLISSGNLVANHTSNLDSQFSNLIEDINQNSVIKNIFKRKGKFVAR